ncbi:MAG TPA: hypothetical protein VKB58_09115 [Terriglobales bacterium]|jgi:hypothetical protein|nr:hypothetical protein [Terriglobales bacterium]
MFFFHDECDLIDDDQYDLFTLTTHIERKSGAVSRQRPASNYHQRCLNPHSPTQTARGRMMGAGTTDV